MRKYPTIAVMEFASIADGIYCTDALLKKAPIAMIKSGTVSGGRYLIIIGGSTASVEESLTEALAVGQASRLDHTFLPDVDPQLHDAVLGQRQPVTEDAVAILETDTVAANVRAAESRSKAPKCAWWNSASRTTSCPARPSASTMVRCMTLKPPWSWRAISCAAARIRPAPHHLPAA